MNEQSWMRPRVIYLPVLLIWMLFLIISMAGIVISDLNATKQQFINSVNSHYAQASDRVRTNEAVLEGFAALIGNMRELDQRHIRKYAQEMLKQYPHIFMFEIIESVPYENLEAFTRHYRETVNPDFRIKSFSYETDRKIKRVEKQDFYMPIVFMEPFPVESHEVLGLDLYSHEFFSHSLKKYSQYKHSVITEPFQLIEDKLAYLIHKPVLVNTTNKNQHEIQRSVMLVILADTLLNRQKHLEAGMTELLHHPDFDSSNEKGYLHLQQGERRSWLETHIFPSYTNSVILENKSQPFVLINKYQLGWDVLSWYQLMFALLVGVISFLVLMAYTRIYHKNEVKRLQTANELFYKANHDALTGLANRNLFFDRLKHALLQAKRLEASLAIIYMDLNGFKMINDTHGHDTGDKLLQSFAERLRGVLRSSDTIARFGGDEFVLIVENLTKLEELNQVIINLRNATGQSFVINEHIINLNISIGYSIYPDDGEDMDSLINQADTQMYQNKYADKIC